MMANIHIGESVERLCKNENKFSIEPYEKWIFFSHYLSERKAQLLDIRLERKVIKKVTKSKYW